jgi:DNA repair protein RadA/Sms
MVETLMTPPAPGKSWTGGKASESQELSDIAISDTHRVTLPLREVNRVLGGGIVPGSLTLIGGDPGIGKSTLLLQVAQAVAGGIGPVVYVSGEESPQQIKLRAARLGLQGKGLYLLAETDLDAVLARLDQARPALVIVDSIQTMALSAVTSAAGSVGQVRECALRLMQWAKSHGVPVMIAGHVTKDGAIAGPRVLEHMVDVVLYLEGEGFSPFRILRGVKNRFGSTNEVGIFEMRDGGMSEVLNPSEAFLAHRQESAIGSAIVPTLEGTRPLLIEIQALATPAGAGPSRRIANGVDFNRLLLILAVLTKHIGLPVGGQDVIVNVVGGLHIEEPAADAAIALAVASSMRDTPLREGCVAMGEVGLSGELRPVNQTERRLAEAAALGFKMCVLPGQANGKVKAPGELKLLYAETLRDAVRLALASRPASL